MCDGELLRRILKEGRVTRVIHLAAQAGVRYSLKKPLEYVKANVQCFVTLLEAVKDVDKSLPITYASSSSVYGLNTKIPFQETDRIVLQASLYPRLQPPSHTVVAAITYGCSLHHLRLQPPPPTVAGVALRRDQGVQRAHRPRLPPPARAAAHGASLLHGLRPHRQARSK